jgi:hypothetical protein
VGCDDFDSQGLNLVECAYNHLFGKPETVEGES